jgi:2-iminobutanoate/2-iminopropanoate deaminase
MPSLIQRRVDMKQRTLVLVVVVGPAAFLAGAAKPETRRYVNIPRPGAISNLPFSDGVLVGNTLYLAGRIGIDPKTNKPPEDAEHEAKLALDGIQATLQQAGMTVDDLVYVQVFCSDVSHFSNSMPFIAHISSAKANCLRGHSSDRGTYSSMDDSRCKGSRSSDKQSTQLRIAAAIAHSPATMLSAGVER